MKLYVVYFCATIACVMAMPDGPALRTYNNVMRVPIEMGENGVKMGRKLAELVDNMMSGNPLRILGSILSIGQNRGRQNTAAQNPDDNMLTQAQGVANSAMGFANNMAKQSTAAATNAMGFMGNMALQGAHTAENLVSSTLQSFQGLVPRIF